MTCSFYHKNLLAFIIILFIGFVTSCDDSIDMTKNYDEPTPFILELDFQIPLINFPDDNLLTEEGIKLGRMLFYDPILSADSTQACASCHLQELGFADKDKFSIGIDGLEGKRRSMPIINVALMKQLFWDGRAISVEDQAKFPVEDPLEMHNIWEDAVTAVSNSNRYIDLFGDAFGTDEVTQDRIMKAIAQFERTIISSKSKFDKVIFEKTAAFTDDELEGQLLFYDEEGGDCFHCHDGGLMTDNLFHNNGLDTELTDLGLFKVTNDDNDKGKFKTPTLRNIELRAPYMHDGRFATLKEVLDHYSEGLQVSPTVDPLLKNLYKGGVELTEEEKWQIIAFLKTMTDTSFINNKSFSSPF